MTAKKEVAVKAESAVPEWLQEHMGDTRGSEEVTGADLVIPRLELCQALSSCRKKNDPSFIEGITEGDLYNNVTREVYGDSVQIIPVHFRKEYLLWRDQKLGGGFGGSYPTEAEGMAALHQQEKSVEWDLVDTNVHFVLVIRENGKLEEAVLSMAKTKAKVSRLFNSLVRLNGGPRFSRIYTLAGVDDQNAAGQDFFNLSISNSHFVSKEQFEIASALYEMIKEGRVKADMSQESAGTAAPLDDDDDAGF